MLGEGWAGKSELEARVFKSKNSGDILTPGVGPAEQMETLRPSGQSELPDCGHVAKRNNRVKTGSRVSGHHSVRVREGE